MRAAEEKHFTKAAGGLGRYAKDARALAEALAASHGREVTASDIDEAVSMTNAGGRFGMEAFLRKRRPDLLAYTRHEWTPAPAKRRRAAEDDE
jgi:hypothetical protein